MILQKMYLLSVVLKNEGVDIFTWEFFLNRFDTLCLEAQLDLESSGDIASLQGEPAIYISFNNSSLCNE